MAVLGRFTWLLAVLATLSVPAAAYDRSYYTTDQPYSLTATWMVAVNLARKSCFLGINYANGVNIEIGLDQSRAEPTYFMMFGSKSWNYEEGQTYGVTLKYDGASTWTGKGFGIGVNAIRGVALEGLEKAAIDEMAAGKRFSLKIGRRDYGRYPLTGTRHALAKMDECIAAIADGRISLAEIAREYEEDRVSPPPNGNFGAKKDETPDDPHGGTPDKADKDAVRAYGTGFFVNGDGYLLTNAHVVEGCEDAMVRQGISGIQPATIVAREPTNDLAILKVNRTSPVFGKFRGAPQIRLGDPIVAFGYPLSGYLSSTGNLSKGVVSALAGAGDEASRLQISAPIQSGNSGGAVVDQSGHVVGVVVAKSNVTPHGTGVEVIQNANFAIKSGIVQFFLDAHQVRYEVEPPGEEMKTPDVANIARSFTAQVICEVKG
ncbi:Trypsin-like peptidase domain-containing protein [Pleomorphomonas diazotrophica]|nr:serine protease [Pleomorphomonas diazotrophica]SFM89894.1 Trypsin-like peptidase domain-containing protein [Pleomorphomonas diazotrophica]